MTEGAQHKAAESLAPGSVVAGRFDVVGSLGVGGMAEVYRATDRRTGEVVALKLLRKEFASQPEAMERLRREADVLQALDDPAVVAMKASGTTEDGRIYLAMELLEGETLGARMRRGKMEPAELRPIVDAIASGLGAAHARDVVHRDLKPENVFLVPDGEEGTQVKILDFGISKVFGREKLTQTGQVLGTPRYMAPEQLTAERDVDARVDLYALGVILYEALASQPPFATTGPSDLIIAILHGKVVPLRSVRPDLPEEVESVVMRAMAKAREARYGSAAELARAWAEVAAGGESPSAEAPRPGMRTDVLGSMTAPEPPAASRGERADATGRTEGESGRPLQIGTFSALEQAEPEAAEEEAEPPGKEQGAPGPSSPPRAAADAPASDAPVERDASARGRGAAPEPSGPLEVPMRKPRGLLVAGALLAGALSAVVAIAVLHAVASDDEDDGAAVAAAPAGSEDDGMAAADDAGTAAAEAVRDAGDDEAPDAAAEQTSEQTEPDGADRGARAAARRRAAARGLRRQRAASAGEQASDRNRSERGSSAESEEPTAGPAELMSKARAALGRAEPARCVELVTEAMQQGAPAFALRLRGDCHLRMGNNGRALADYRRFCRLAPDHPAIGEVRALVESYGQSCP